jgi:putative addiction module component (TIGR02574 family)
MGLPLEKIEAELLKLPHEARAHLVEVLKSSLEDGDTDEEQIADEWAEEAHRRLQEILAGEAETIPATEAVARVRARLRS